MNAAGLHDRTGPLVVTVADASADGAMSDITESPGIVTPEAVVLDVETAGYATRILAGLIDLILQLILLSIGGTVVGVALAGSDSDSRTIVAVLVFLVLFGYPIGFETWLRGRTPGKMALGVRAVTLDGAPIRLRDATLRAMGGVVDKVLPPGGVTGALFVTLTPRHQRVGDLIAGTMVIRDPDRHVALPALWFSAPPGLTTYAETIDPTSITVDQYTLVRSFLTRGAALPTAIRATIALDLADRLAIRIRHAIPMHVPPEIFLICAMARYQRRNGPGVAAATSMARPAMPGAPARPVARS